MSKCDLKVVFDRADRVYHPGETISGNVEVEVNKDVKCNALKIEMRWQTHGKGNTDFEIMAETEEPEMEWNAGSMLRFPFRFKAPKMPLTYHGHFLNIDHYIRATADIPWAIDPKTSEEFILKPGESSERDYREEGADEETTVEKKKTGILGKGCGWVVGILVLGLLIYCLVAFWFVFVIIGVIVALAALEVNIAPLLAAVGAAGFVVGFALQDTLS
ncbi:MAG: mechanosensitive ion channel, partial [bacterium]|nr:mechanosensitive ion channel [bacterium]